MNAVRHSKLGVARGGIAGTWSRRSRPVGMSLIELIVVLAIVALLAGIAIPTMVRTGAFGKNNLPDSARQLLGLLKAARSYSATHRIDTAVIYTLKEDTDTKTGEEDVQFIYALAVARRMTNDEIDKLDDPGGPLYDLGDDIFVTINAEEARFQKLATDTCIYNIVADMATAHSEYNVYGIPLYDADSAILIEPVVLIDEEWVFPAHIFRSNGMLRGAEAYSKRVLINMEMAPTAPVEDRFTDDSFTDDVEPITIELFPVTGRSKIRES